MKRLDGALKDVQKLQTRVNVLGRKLEKGAETLEEVEEEKLMINPKELTFEETKLSFALWLDCERLSAYQQDPKIFNEVDAPLKLGVGKNMVSSIKYWLKAYDIISPEGEITEFGTKIFDLTTGLDPYSEDENDPLAFALETLQKS